MIKRHLAALLKDDPTIRELVDGKIFPGRARQGYPMPYVVLTTGTGQPFNDLPGEANYTRAAIEVDVFASTDRASAEISQAIRRVLSGFRGMAGEAWIEGCALENPPRGRVIRPVDGSDNWTFSTTSDYDVVYDQAPTLNC